MNPQIAIIALIIIFVVIGLKMRKFKPKKIQKPKGGAQHNAKKIMALLSKETPTPCLIQDGRLYGESFHSKEPPELPCCEGCKCRVEKFNFKSSDVFAQQKTSEVRYESDLGMLSFIEYKYYKYSLILHHSDLDEEELKSFEEIRLELNADESFAQKVENHLKTQGKANSKSKI